MPITWRNVSGQTSDPAELLRGASQSINNGFTDLDSVLKKEQTRRSGNFDQVTDNNNDAVRNLLNSFQTPEDLQAAQDSGLLEREFAKYAPGQVDQDLLRTGFRDRLTGLRTQEGTDRTYNDGITERALQTEYANNVATVGQKEAEKILRQNAAQSGLTGDALTRVMGYSTSMENELDKLSTGEQRELDQATALDTALFGAKVNDITGELGTLDTKIQATLPSVYDPNNPAQTEAEAIQAGFDELFPNIKEDGWFDFESGEDSNALVSGIRDVASEVERKLTSLSGGMPPGVNIYALALEAIGVEGFHDYDNGKGEIDFDAAMERTDRVIDQMLAAREKAAPLINRRAALNKQLQGIQYNQKASKQGVEQSFRKSLNPFKTKPVVPKGSKILDAALEKESKKLSSNSAPDELKEPVRRWNYMGLPGQ